jgi:hypothetical protein
MSRGVRLSLFLAGAGMFAWLVSRVGIGRLLADAAATGWMIIPIVLLFAVVYACSTQAWRLVMADEPNRPPFHRAYAILISGQAINFVTPLVNAGGEPYKIAALAPRLGGTRAAGSVILHTMLKMMSAMLVWVSALVLGLVLLPHRSTVVTLELAALGLVGGLVLLLMLGHRHGVVERAFDVMGRIPGLRRLARTLEPRRPMFAELDRQITTFWREHPRRFAQAVALEYAARCVFMVEFCLIGASIGVHVSYPQAFVIGGLETLIGNLLFLVPFELGTREGAISLLFGLLGLGSGVGIYAAIVGRVRDILWIGFGLLLIWTGGRAGARAPAAPHIEETA